MPSQEMNIQQITEVVKFSIDASKKSKYKLPVCIWGIHGTGKTQLVEQIADEMGYNLVVLHLAMQDICDLIGIPTKVEYQLPDGSKDTIQIWACPQWLHNANESYKKTGKPNLFFLDEFNRGNRFVLAAMLPFLIEGVLHAHHIGPEDAVIAAANPANEKYEVNELTDEALLNRMAHVVFKPTHTEYVNFLKRNEVDKTTVKVVQNQPSYTKIPDFDLGFDVKPSRRSIFNVMGIIGKKGHSWIKNHGSYVIDAYLGAAFRDEWLAEYQSKDMSITLEMLQDFDNNKQDIELALTTIIDEQITHRTDILSKTLDIIKTYIKDRKDKISAVDVTWMIKFFKIGIIPSDASAAVFMANPDMKRAIMQDANINILLTNFLRAHGIIPADSISPWAADADNRTV
jgi:hypothetical protein